MAAFEENYFWFPKNLFSLQKSNTRQASMTGLESLRSRERGAREESRGKRNDHECGILSPNRFTGNCNR